MLLPPGRRRAGAAGRGGAKRSATGAGRRSAALQRALSLRGQLDKLELTAAQRGEARAAFLEAVACEKAFWEMARGVGDGEL